MKQWDKAAVYRLLTERGIWHEITEHPAVYNMEEMAAVDLPYPEADGKNLFVRDDKKRQYYLITVRGDKRVDLKAFRQANHTRPLSFASAEDLWDKLGLTPGSVTPLGLLGREGGQVELFLDQAFLAPPGLIGVHPNDNTATLSPCCGTTAPPSAWCRCKGALVLALALLGKVRALTRSMEEICDQLADRLQGDTNNLLTLTLAFPGEGPPQTP